MKRKSINNLLRKRVLERDNGRCIKCGRSYKLEVHHIIPVYRGGLDEEWNLITLCKKCHDFAPDEPIEFYKWAARSIPAEVERTLDLLKSLVPIIILNPKFHKKDFSKNPELLKDLIKFMEDSYKDLWKVYVSNEVNMLSNWLKEYFKPATNNLICEGK